MVRAHPVPGDPLLYDLPLPLRLELNPLGFPLLLETNCDDVARAARESWGSNGKRFNRPAIHIRAGVVGEARATPPPPVFRGQHNLMSIVADSGNSAVCDLDAGFGFCWVTPDVAANPDYFRYYFLEAITYTLLSALYLAPVHAACVDRHGKGVLLYGDSGAGKSSLAYACARRGWRFVCDDAAHIVREPGDCRVIGDGRRMRFRPDAPVLFPELASALARVRPNGKMTIEVPTSGMPEVGVADESRPSWLLFLDRRQDERPQLSPVTRTEAFERLSAAILYGHASMRAAWDAAYRDMVTTCRTSTFTYWDLDAAIDRLEALLNERA